MVGQTIRSRRSFSWAAAILVLSALALAGGGYANGIHVGLLLALLPLSIALALTADRLRTVTIQFTETELTVTGKPPVAYDAIESLLAVRSDPDPQRPGKAHYLIQVLHRGGVLLIPARLDVRSDAVYRFLYERLQTGGARAVNDELAGYLSAHEKHYGAAQVRSYRARAHLGVNPERRFLTAVGLACIATGLLWFGMGQASASFKVWTSLGILVGLVGGALLIIRWLDRGSSQSIKNWKASSLVIGPAGLAMIQGDVRGEVTWQQVREVQFNPKPSFFSVQVNQLQKGIFLHVEGAHIVIADIYDRPLYAIFQAIQYCRLRYR